ncbi:MAG: Fic family protein, partial [Elusimicrobia bacterium]|nr:Fic family protein [Elusimicrobiota bacterium]
MRRYIWELPGWPELTIQLDEVEERLSAAQFALGEVAGVLRTLGSADRRTIELDALADTALQTSEIEGEHLSADSVRASLARRLGLDHLASAPTDPRADGVVAMSIDATLNAAKPLTKKRLVEWQSGLFPDAPRSLTVGDWRGVKDDPMRVVSGPVSARAVHFEAPPAARVKEEMRAFLRWFEAPPAANRRAVPPLVRAALAHLRFLTIHPFADGNGRIGRAIADLVLARADSHVAPYISLSRRIRKERAAYYEAISRAQCSGLDATAWTAWFIDCYRRSTADTLRSADSLIRAATFWRDHAGVEINARQRKVLERYLGGQFEGWLNSRNY